MRHLLRLLFAMLLCCALVPTALAKGGPPAGKGPNAAHGQKDKDKDKDKDRDRDDDDRGGRAHRGDRDNDRDDTARGTGPSSRPPGWDKGKKTGWGDCDVPPGQAKKEGCNHTTTRHAHTRSTTKGKNTTTQNTGTKPWFKRGKTDSKSTTTTTTTTNTKTNTGDRAHRNPR